MRTVVIIPSHNSDEFLKLTVHSIQRQTRKPYKILIVNDRSKNETIYRELQNYPNTEILTTDHNGFRAGAVNKGLERANELCADSVLLIDDDTILHEKVIEVGEKILEKFPEIGAVCSKARIFKPEGILQELQDIEYSYTNTDRIMEGTTVAHGMCSMYRMCSLGNFNEKMIIEDWDKSMELRRVRWKIVYSDKMIAWTRPVKSWKKLWKQRLRWYTGALQIMIKYPFSKFALKEAFSRSLFLILFGCIIYSLKGINSFSLPNLISFGGVVAGLSIGECYLHTHITRIKKNRWIALSIIPLIGYAMFLSTAFLWSHINYFRRNRW